MSQMVGLEVGTLEARLALAKIRAGQSDQAMEICERLNESDNAPKVELGLPYFELGQHDRARDCAVAGYKKSWGNGPPYARWWELRECSKVLELVGEPEPQLPRFDPNNVVRLPYQDEIKLFIDYVQHRRW